MKAYVYILLTFALACFCVVKLLLPSEVSVYKTQTKSNAITFIFDTEEDLIASYIDDDSYSGSDIQDLRFEISRIIAQPSPIKIIGSFIIPSEIIDLFVTDLPPPSRLI